MKWTWKRADMERLLIVCAAGLVVALALRLIPEKIKMLFTFSGWKQAPLSIKELARNMKKSRKHSLRRKIILLVAIVFCTATLLILRTMIQNTRQESENLRATAAWYEQENAELTQNIALLGTEKSIRRIATEELGLVDPDATFFQSIDSTNPE